MASVTQHRRGEPRVSPGGAVVTARVVAVVSVTATVAAIWIDRRSSAPVAVSVADVVVATAYPVLAAFVLRARPQHRAGHLLLTTGLLGPYLLAGAYAADAVARGEQGSLLVDVGTWLSMWGFAPYWVVVALVPLYLPDGTLEQRGWARYAHGMMALQAAGLVGAMFAARSPDVAPALVNPLAISSPPFRLLLAAAGIGSFAVGGPVGLVALVRRLRQAKGLERARIGWLVVGVASLVSLALLSVPFAGTIVSDVLLASGLAIVPLTIGIAVVRHGLFDREVVLRRTIVYGTSTVLILAIYAAVVAIVGGVGAGTRWALPVVAVAALAASGMRERLQHGVDRLLYGERRDPYAVIARTGDRLEGARSPRDALDALVIEIRGLLRVPGVMVVPVDPRLPMIAAGVVGDHHHFLPLSVQGSTVGELRVAHREPGERLRRSERGALLEVARRAATLVWIAVLVDDLQRSRDEAQRRGEQIVVAREDERRRIRRDLHDGVGPELAGMALQMDRLTRRLAEPELAEQAAALRDQLRRTVVAVRGVVDGLRPPALDDVGLVAALRSHVLAGVDADEQHVVDVRAHELTGLPAALEVAAYRIATEALTNAVRHGRARHCLVELCREEGVLVVRITDDGVGLTSASVPGVGTESMRERAAELGGWFELTSAPTGGTIVTARLPEDGR